MSTARAVLLTLFEAPDSAELMRGEPVWPGKTDLDQLYMIKSSLGQLTAGQTHTLLTRNLYDQVSTGELINQQRSGG